MLLNFANLTNTTDPKNLIRVAANTTDQSQPSAQHHILDIAQKNVQFVCSLTFMNRNVMKTCTKTGSSRCDNKNQTSLQKDITKKKLMGKYQEIVFLPT